MPSSRRDHSKGHRHRGGGGHSSGGGGIGTLTTLIGGLVFISVVIFLVAPHDHLDMKDVKKSLMEEEKNLLHRGTEVEEAVIDWVSKRTHLRTVGEGGAENGGEATTSNLNSANKVVVKKSGDKKEEAPPSSSSASSLVPRDEEESLHRTTMMKKSNYAYVTLLSGLDESFRYRGFLYNVMIMRKALRKFQSKADFIVMIGFQDYSNTAMFEKDLDLLREHDIIIHVLPRWTHEQHDLTFAEMALLKITPWSFTQYDKVQFFDGDVMPTSNMDCFFELSVNSFTAGAVSALNSGWYLAIPNMNDYKYLKEKAIWRLGRDWDKEIGWKEPMPSGLVVRGGRPASSKWDFNGADMDQGLLLHYHVINKGNAMLIDTQTRLAMTFGKGGLADKSVFTGLDVRDALECCKGKLPTSMFAHFTGRSKPWMFNNDNEKNRAQFDRARNRGDTRKWFELLDSLNIQKVNSKTIGDMHLGSPLGFWNHNFPKGGMTTKVK